MTLNFPKRQDRAGLGNASHAMLLTELYGNLSHKCTLQADVATAALAAATATGPAAPSAQKTDSWCCELEQADLLQHADSLKQQYADVVAEVLACLLTGVGVCHFIATHFSASSHEYVQLAPVELQQGIGKS